MRFFTTEQKSFSPGSGGQPTTVETLELKDRNGNVLVTFQKSASGVFTATFEGDLTDGDNNTLSTVASDLTSLEAAVTALQAGEGVTLPTADPEVEGALWSDGGTVKVSAGAP